MAIEGNFKIFKCQIFTVSVLCVIVGTLIFDGAYSSLISVLFCSKTVSRHLELCFTWLCRVHIATVFSQQPVTTRNK